MAQTWIRRAQSRFYFYYIYYVCFYISIFTQTWLYDKTMVSTKVRISYFQLTKKIFFSYFHVRWLMYWETVLDSNRYWERKAGDMFGFRKYFLFLFFKKIIYKNDYLFFILFFYFHYILYKILKIRNKIKIRWQFCN